MTQSTPAIAVNASVTIDLSRTGGNGSLQFHAADSQTGSTTAGITTVSGGASITVNGTAVHIAISFSVTKYAVTFMETGLPSGTSWSVTLDGTAQNSTADTITFMEPNGTFSFSVGLVTGYAVSLSSGNVTVSGKAVNESVS